MPNKVYTAIESGVTFTDSSGDVVLPLASLAFNAGVVSNQYDRGEGSKPKLHKIRGVFNYNTAPQSGEAIEIYLYESDGTYVDGNIGSTSGALPTLKRLNGMFVGAVIADVVTSGTNIVGSFNDVPICSRYYSIGVWNSSSADNFNASANTSRVIVTPIPDEIQ